MTTDPKAVEMMYWLKDKSWYSFDPGVDVEYHLTEEAPARAKKAYAEWLKNQK